MVLCPAGCSSIGRESVSPQLSTVNPVDDEEMEGEQDNLEAPTLALRFLQQHRPAGIARDDTGDNDESIGNDDGTEEPREADGDL